MTQAKGTVSDAPTTNMRLTWRTSAVSSASGPTMKPGVSHSERTGSPKASHSCRKRAALSALAASMAPARCMRVVGDHADRPALHPGQRRHQARGERRPQLEHRPLVGQQLDRPPDVVDTPPVGRHDVAQPLLLRRRPLPHVPLEVRQVPAGHLDGFLLIGAEDIDDPVRHLHRDRPDLLRAVHAQPASLDHGRATHADVGVGRGDDDVAASRAARRCRRSSVPTPRRRAAPCRSARRRARRPRCRARSRRPCPCRPVGHRRPRRRARRGGAVARTSSKRRSFLRWFIWPWVPARTE